jgi:hypothetical protein
MGLDTGQHELSNNHRIILAFFDIKDDGADLVCYGPGAQKSNFKKDSNSRSHALRQLSYLCDKMPLKPAFPETDYRNETETLIIV